MSLTNWYVPQNSLPNNQKRGAAYDFAVLVVVGLHVILILQAWLQLQNQKGIRRIEMQFFVLNVGIATLFATISAFVGNTLQLHSVKLFGPVVIIGAFALTAWAICYHRIFNARQVFGSLIRRAFFLFFLIGGTFILDDAFGRIVQPAVRFILSISVAYFVAFWFDRVARAWLGASTERATAGARSRAIEIARTNSEPSNLITSFERLLCHQFDASSSHLMFDTTTSLTSKDLDFGKSRPGYDALCENGWATSES
ncbi:MAG: hypothetical protein EXS35_19120 [Pedosphaera sp.]|nr:hypothetical protein [Pedosphaera sp.]